MRDKRFIPILSVFMMSTLLYLTMLYQHWYTTEVNIAYKKYRFRNPDKSNPLDGIKYIYSDPYTDIKNIHDEINENEKSQYQFLDENSNTTNYPRFQLLNIPKAFFIHNPSEMCSDMGWHYDFSSKFLNKSVDNYKIKYKNERNNPPNDETLSPLYQSYLKFINDGMSNREDQDYLLKEKLDPASQLGKQHTIPYKQMSLIIGIFTRPKEFEMRQNVRKIWASPFSAHLKSSYSISDGYIGSYLTFNNSHNEMVVCKIKTVFVLGIFEPQTEEFMSKSVNISKHEVERWNKNFNRERREVQKAINAESMIHGDIIQATFGENYRNLSYKTGALLKWVSIHCNKAQFLLKVDIDNYVRLDILMSVLEKITTVSIESAVNINKMVINNEKFSKNNSHNKNDAYIIGDNNIEKEITPLAELMEFQKNLYCYVWEGLSTNRVYGHKNFVDKEEYKAEYYPKFCSGWGYLMSPQLAGIFYNWSLESSTKPFPNEDVFWTGIIPKKIKGVHYKPLNSFYKWTDDDSGNIPYIFSFYSGIKHLRKLYYRNSHF
ncbi:unnamed protein product [Gordionus sp. m RMFG-2023]